MNDNDVSVEPLPQSGGQLDLRVELKFKNAPLWRAIFTTHESVAALCRQHGLSQGPVGELLTLKRSPYNKKNGKLTYVAGRLCEILAFSPGELFPLAIYTGIIPSNVATEIQADRITSLSDPSLKLLDDSMDWEAGLVANLDKQLLAGQMAKVLHTITPREENVLRQRYFKDETFLQIAESMGITRERVRQIETKALRKLRHPSRKRGLVEHLD